LTIGGEGELMETQNKTEEKGIHKEDMKNKRDFYMGTH
jgi:hypothetical protein